MMADQSRQNRFVWYKSDTTVFWIVDEVLGYTLGRCGSQAVAERLCRSLNALESEIVWNWVQSIWTMPVATVLQTFLKFFENGVYRTEMIQNRAPWWPSGWALRECLGLFNHYLRCLHYRGLRPLLLCIYAGVGGITLYKVSTQGLCH